MFNADIAELPFFNGFNAKHLEQIKPLFRIYDCHAGTLLFEQGDPAEFLYLVIDGEVTIRYKPDDGAEIIVAHVKSGGVVGWSAALGNRHYTSGAICGKHSQLLRVRGNDLRTLYEKNPDTGEILLDRLAMVIAERLRSTHGEIMNLLKNSLTINNIIR